MASPQFDLCHACDGPNVGVDGPGRFRRYRGFLCELPADLVVDTCQSCGAQWLSHTQIEVLSESFEAQRLAAEKRSDG